MGPRHEPIVAEHLRPLGIRYDADVAAEVAEAASLLQAVRATAAWRLHQEGVDPDRSFPSSHDGRFFRGRARRKPSSSCSIRRGGPTSPATWRGTSSAAGSWTTTRAASPACSMSSSYPTTWSGHTGGALSA